jgi:hypothetical protein
MGNVQIYSTGLVGLSFSIAELTLVEAWAEAQGLRMVVRLDHGSETEEYEEVIAFRTTWGRPRRAIMWRDYEAVYLQPLIGRTRRYRSVAETIASLTPRQTVAVTDVTAPNWPA